MDDRNSFWNVMKRLLSGRPAFVSFDANLEEIMNYRPPQPNREDLLRDAAGNVIKPRLELRHYIDHLKNDAMVLYLDMTNRSKLCLQVRDVYIFGATREVDKIIEPGESARIEAYSGAIPETTNQCYLNIIYRELYSGVGHLFKNQYLIKFVPYHGNLHYLAYGFHELN